MTKDTVLSAEELEAEMKWRDLALQFDGHRIEALSMLRLIVRQIEEYRTARDILRDPLTTLKAFLAKPPLSGEAVLARRIDALRHSRASGVRALEWRRDKDWRYEADCAFGRFTVYLPNDGGPWFLTLGRDRIGSPFVSADEAKAAAQSHFNASIQSCLVAEGVENKAAADVLAERIRQVEVEGWTPEHDDIHSEGEMGKAAGVYALAASSHDYRWVLRGSPVNDYLAAAFKMWPWDLSWFKPKDRRRDLVKAGALILAEIERLDRVESISQAQGEGV